MAEQEAKTKAAEAAAKAANPEAFKALEALKKTETEGGSPADMIAALKESAAELMAALQNPKPAQPAAAAAGQVEVEMKTGK